MSLAAYLREKLSPRYLFTAVAALFALLGTFRALYDVWATQREQEFLRARTVEAARAYAGRSVEQPTRQLDETRHQLANAQEEILRLRALNQPPGLPSKDSESKKLMDLTARVDILSGAAAKVETIGTRIDSIEKVVVDNPQKAIALAAFRKDLDTLQVVTNQQIDQLRRENDRLYDLTKWLVGIMSFVSISLIGVAVGNLFKRPEPPAAPTFK